MSRYKIRDQFTTHFVTLTVVDWVDVFIRKTYKDMLLDSLRYCQQQKGLEVYAYVIMSSHVHLVAAATGGVPLSDILRDFKKYTARQLLQAIAHSGSESRREWLLHRFAYRGNLSDDQRQYQFWQSDNHPIELWSLPVIVQKINYVHNNPVEEGWVAEAAAYVYSSASNYQDGRGILAMTVLDLPNSWAGYVP